MPDAGVLLTFCSATLVLLLLPGPAVLYVVTQTVRLGLGRGLIGALGVECGTLLHAAAATAGLSALLTRSDVAFAVVKYAGVAYLVLLGWRQLRNVDRRGGRRDGVPAPAPQSGWTAFRQGFVVESLNPKTALFFIAFLPQFVDRGAGDPTLQVGLLGCLFVGLAFVVDASYAVLASGATRWLSGGRPGRRLDQAGGVALLGLAALAAAA